MHSLRTKITVPTICVIIIAVIIVTLFSVIFIRSTEERNSDQMLLLLCETGERNLDYYFNSVEHSVEKVASFVEEDLDGLETEKLDTHMDRVLKYFDEMAYKTNGVLTYYYRVDPECSKDVKGFWYTNLDGEGFVEHEVTDITQYDTSDTSKLVWFTVPKYEGEAIWLPPYITDNLDVRVLSYNVPIYYKDRFVGVIGIEIDYTTMAEQVSSIRLYNNGYAFINDDEGNLIYHPLIDVTQMSADERPKSPEGLLADSTFVTYEFEGVEKKAAWLKLENGMRLNVCAPIAEINGDWQKLIWQIMAASLIVLLLASISILRFSGRITKPLRELTAAAEQVDKGNYNISLGYDKDDEVGRLSRTFERLVRHMKDHISDLSKQVYVDALTSVRNKGAFSAYIAELQNHLEDPEEQTEFAVSVFDCDDLKSINDQYGHEMGDTYLKTASRLICRVFQHSPVFRIGGDEFAAILQNEDYQNREDLTRQFGKEMEKTCASAENAWEQVHVTMGISVYDPNLDSAVIDTVRRADKDMYENKRAKKEAKKGVHHA